MTEMVLVTDNVQSRCMCGVYHTDSDCQYADRTETREIPIGEAEERGLEECKGPACGDKMNYGESKRQLWREVLHNHE